MSESNKYINSKDFHSSNTFLEINKDIDICLSLIQKLLSFNQSLKSEVQKTLSIPEYILDYRLLQFGYFENTLQSVYYNCYSLKNFYEVSTFMNFKGINNTLGYTFNNQRSYITFNSIVKMSSIFEFTRKEYERTINGKNYFKAMKEKFPNHAHSLELLNNFRNTVHSNGTWEKTTPLEYETREGLQSINKGETFNYDYWTLYKMIKDCLELHKLLALSNEAVALRKTIWKVNGQRLSSVKTDMNLADWDKLINKHSSSSKFSKQTKD